MTSPRHIATVRIPKPETASYRAAVYIHASGPQTTEELFAAVNCGVKQSNRRLMIESALSTGWLIESNGKIDISDTARTHFGDTDFEPKVPPTGSTATPREPLTPVYSRPPLSKRFIPNSKGTRSDVPEFSVRSGMSFRTVAGGSV